MTKLDLPYQHSNFYKEKPIFNIQREYALKDCLYKVNKLNKCIFITGEEGIGKTVFLSQITESLEQDVVTLFLNPLNSLSCDPELIKQDIVEQISWIVNGHGIEQKSFSSVKTYSSYCNFLSKYCDSNRKEVVFIIDGLDDIESDFIFDSIIDFLPFHIRYFKFLISSNNQELYDKFLKADYSIDYFSVPLMNDDECYLFFKDVDKCDVDDILRAYPPVPEKLMSIKRLVDKGYTVSDILDKYGEHNDSFIEGEFKFNKELIDKNELVISFVVFCPIKVSITEICEVFGVEKNVFLDVLNSMSIIRVNGTLLEIVSSAMADYLKIELAKNRAKLDGLIKDFISTKKTNSENILSILNYKRDVEDYEGVIKELSSESIVDIYRDKNSLNSLQQILKIGVDASVDEAFYVDKIKFSHLSSLFKGVSEISVLKSEIECYLKEGDFSSAIRIANSINIIEDKIQILAMIATGQKSSDLVTDEDIVSQIQYLYSGIDIEHLEIETAMDISVAIFPIFPELSFNIISKIDGSNKSGGNKSDYAYARLYFEAVLKNSDELDSLDLDSFNVDDKFKDSMRKIKDLKAGDSLSKLFNNIKSLGIQNGDKIGLIAESLKLFPDFEGAQELVSYSLDLITETPDFSSNCTVYRDLSSSLTNVINQEVAESNYRKIINQLPRLEKIGPTVDYVDVLLNLAEYESKYKNCTDRHRDIFNYVKNNINDLLVSMRSIMSIQASWHKLEFNNYWGVLQEHKNSVFNDLLKVTAQHYTLLKDVIVEEALINLSSSMVWCNKINTQERRDRAICNTVVSYILSNDQFDIDECSKYIKRIKSDFEFTRAARVLASKLSTKEIIKKSSFDKVRKLKNKIINNNDKSHFIAYLITSYSYVDGSTEEVKDNLINELKESFSAIDADWNKVNAGFSLANILIKKEAGLANYFRNCISEIRDDSTIDVSEIKSAYSRCVDLAIRCNNSILKFDYKEDNVSSIIKRIDMLSGNIEKSRLYARLISSIQNNNYNNQARVLIEKYICPLLDSYCGNEGKEYSLVFYSLSPVVFNYDKEMFNKYLGLVSDENLKNEMVSNTISNIFEKVMVFEPFYYTDKHSYKMSFIEVKDVFNLASFITFDWLVYSNVKRLTLSLKMSCKNDSFTQTQKLEIPSFYDALINMMPMDGGVAHEGYKICLEALKLNFKNEKSMDSWFGLIERARKISNLADSVYTESCVLELATNLKTTKRKELLIELIQKVNKVEVSIEKIDLIETIYSSCKEIDRALVKKSLRDALLLTTDENTFEFERKRKELIDSFFEVDSKLSSTLTSLTDLDPHRRKLIADNVEQKKKIEKLNDSFSDFGSSKLEAFQQDDFSKFCHDQLAKINANKAVKRKSSQLLGFLKNIQCLDSNNLHVVLSFFVQAYADNFKKKNLLISHIQPIFDSFISNSTLFCEVYKIKTTFTDVNVDTEDSLVLDLGSEQVSKASDFIKRWFNKSKVEEIFISEPYFSLEDLSFINECIDRDYSTDVKVVTSLAVYEKFNKEMQETGGFTDLDEYLEYFWSQNICPDSNPRIEIFFAGTKSTREPLLHDRWWLNGKGVGGVKLGTSINGIGSKVSGINILSPDDASNVYNRMNGITKKLVKESKGEKVVYKSAMII
ncbi:hypothetical protein [Pseudoalteromonas lipolytica]|uniref:NACHT domain-containing protein n=1 Tax=Pseudoalteromonas lipolytica TaxID=570156 RepID=A0ABU8SQF9_9GAMM